MAVEKKKPVEELPVQRADQLDAQPDAPTWLVRDLWLHLGVGWCAGAPKTTKTHVVLDVAVSVASGTACLGHFVVEQPGPVLVYLAEDALPRVRERIAALCVHRHIDLAALELYVITAPRLQLDVAADRQRLDATLKRLNPRLLILDPLVRLHGCDESSAPEMAALLGFLRELSRRHSLAITVVHHLTKKGHRRHGEGLRGSGDLWAWSDSAAYLTRRDDKIEMVLEHRSAAAPAPITLTLVPGPAGQAPHLELVAGGSEAAAPPPPLGEQVRALLATVSKPRSRAALRKKLHVNNQRLGEALTFLERHGMVERTEAGWRLAKPSSFSSAPASETTPTTTSASPSPVPTPEPHADDQISLPLFERATPPKKGEP
jgi:hypothetical protein